MDALTKGSPPEKAKTPQGVEAEGVFKTTPNTDILPQLEKSIKDKLLSGNQIRLVDYPAEQRAMVIGILAGLRDELPIQTGWQTIRQSHLSETRVRAKRYSIPGEFLIDENAKIKGAKS